MRDLLPNLAVEFYALLAVINSKEFGCHWYLILFAMLALMNAISIDYKNGPTLATSLSMHRHTRPYCIVNAIINHNHRFISILTTFFGLFCSSSVVNNRGAITIHFIAKIKKAGKEKKPIQYRVTLRKYCSTKYTIGRL